MVSSWHLFIILTFPLSARFKMLGLRSWPRRNARWLRVRLGIFTSTKLQRYGENPRESSEKCMWHRRVPRPCLITEIGMLVSSVYVCRVSLGVGRFQVRVNILTGEQPPPVQKSLQLVCSTSHFCLHFCTELKIDLLCQQLFCVYGAGCDETKWLEAQKNKVWEKRWRVIMLML